jgi:hypothetical protein
VLEKVYPKFLWARIRTEIVRIRNTARLAYRPMQKVLKIRQTRPYVSFFFIKKFDYCVFITLIFALPSQFYMT